MAKEPGSTAGRPLRRTERKLTRDQAIEVIEATDHAVLSTCDEAGFPYGVPVSPVLCGSALYFHTTKTPGGRKSDNMLMNPKVSLCFVAKATTLPEWYSVDFASAIVTGRARPVEDPDEAGMAFAAFLRRHAPGNSAERNRVQGRVRGPLAMLWRVDIVSITGKARGAAKWETGKSLREVQDMGPSAWLVGVPL